MTMTVAMLAAETLTEKNRLQRQAKCEHEEVFSSTCAGPAGTFTTAVCMDCGKTWRGQNDTLSDVGSPTAVDK